MNPCTVTMLAYQRAVAECAGRDPDDVLTDANMCDVWLWCAHHDGGVPFYALAESTGAAWFDVVRGAARAKLDAANIRERVRLLAAEYLKAEV